jgi:hypothetical protein
MVNLLSCRVPSVKVWVLGVACKVFALTYVVVVAVLVLYQCPTVLNQVVFAELVHLYTHIGVACTYEQNSTYKYYWEQFFVATTKKLDNQTIPEKYKTVPISSGDINGDSEINSFDLITLNRYLADDTMFLNDLQIQSADMFKDGVITSADAAALRKYLLGDYKTLPVTLDMLMK